MLVRGQVCADAIRTHAGGCAEDRLAQHAHGLLMVSLMACDMHLFGLLGGLVPCGCIGRQTRHAARTIHVRAAVGFGLPLALSRIGLDPIVAESFHITCMRTRKRRKRASTCAHIMNARIHTHVRARSARMHRCMHTRTHMHARTHAYITRSHTHCAHSHTHVHAHEPAD